MRQIISLFLIVACWFATISCRRPANLGSKKTKAKNGPSTRPAPKAARKKTILARFQKGEAGHLALDSESIYVALSGEEVLPSGVVDNSTLKKGSGQPKRRAGPQWNGSLVKLPKRGGAPAVLVKELGRTFLVATDESGVYYTALTKSDYIAATKRKREGDNREPSQRLFSIGKKGGSPKRKASAVTSFAMDATHLYVGHIDVDGDSDAGTLERMPKRGGKPERLASDVHLVLANAPTIVVDRDHCYFLAPKREGMKGAVMKVPKSGGKVTVCATGQSDPFSLAMDKDHLYWTNRKGATVMMLSKACGRPVVLAKHSGRPGDELGKIEVDSEYVYWAVHHPNDDVSFVRLAKGGGKPTVLGQGRRVQTFTLGETALYWTEARDAVHVVKLTM